MLLYTGSHTCVPKNDPLGISGAVVKEMLAQYLGKGHILYVDNWYTSPLLCKYLHKQRTGICGTVRENRKCMPKLPATQKKGDVCRKKCGNILAVKWKDKRSVTTLSTLHTGELANSGKINRKGEELMKPDIIVDFNVNMRLVDKSDMMVGDVECIRKTVKWYKKFFSTYLTSVCSTHRFTTKLQLGKKCHFANLFKPLYVSYLNVLGIRQG